MGWKPIRPMFYFLCDAILKPCLPHPCSKRACGGIAFPVDLNAFFEVVIDKPLIRALMRIESDGQDSSSGAQDAACFCQEGGFIGEMMEGINTKHSVKRFPGQGNRSAVP